MFDVLLAAFFRLHLVWQVVVVAAGLYAVHLLLNWLTRDRPKDHTRRGTAGFGNALLEVHSMLEPDRRHLREARLEERIEEERSGDPPSPRPAAREVSNDLS